MKRHLTGIDLRRAGQRLTRTGFLPCLTLLQLVLLLVRPLTAQDIPATPESEQSEGTRPGHFSVFVGASSDFDAGQTGFAMAASYRYEIIPGISLGPVAEVTLFPEETSYLLLAALRATLKEHFELTAAPGVEIFDPKEQHVESETGFAFRVGVGYEVPVHRMVTLTPEVNFDVASGKTRLVYGASLSIEF